MYISKKILIFLSLIFSFVCWMVYASDSINFINSINWRDSSIAEWDVITAEYYNNLNWVKDEWAYCKYSWGKLVCIDWGFPEYTLSVCWTWTPTACTLVCPSWFSYVTHVWPTDYDWDWNRYVVLCKK